MEQDRSAERVRKLTTCSAAICGFLKRQACGNLQVTYDMYRNLHKSDKFQGILLCIPVNCLAVNCISSVLRLRYILTMFAEHPCSVCESVTMYDLHSLHTAICQSCKTTHVLAQRQRKTPNDSQFANHSRKEDQGFQVTNRSR